MQKLRIGLIREGKQPVDRRVPLTPQQAAQLQEQYPGVKVYCQSSRIRCYTDDEYAAAGIEVVENIDRCDVLLGIKETPIADLIPGKTYLFFSHTIKKQPYNRKLLQEILRKKIRLIDYECLRAPNGERIVAFGRWAGIVGAYNGIYAYGLRHGLYQLKRASDCFDYEELRQEFAKIKLPPIKIAITGTGRVGSGARETIESLGVQRIWPKDLHWKYDFPVYAQLFSRDYYERRDGEKFNIRDFYSNPEAFATTFRRFLPHIDLLIVGAYWDPRSDALFSQKDMLSDDFRISVIADISCDIDGPVPSTKKASSIDDPLYDYNAVEDKVEAPLTGANNVTVMAVDNLPSELPRDASHDFGKDLSMSVLPYLLGVDEFGIIENATIAKGGALTERYSYLTDYAAGKE